MQEPAVFGPDGAEVEIYGRCTCHGIRTVPLQNGGKVPERFPRVHVDRPEGENIFRSVPTVISVTM